MNLLRRLRPVGVFVALVCSTGVLGAGSAAAQSNGSAVDGSLSDTTVPGNINITQMAAPGGGACLPQFMAMRYTAGSQAGTFRLRIILDAPLCQRIDAVAAIYAMPGKGVAWPQTLVETRAFSLKDPGVTEVVFTNNCQPVQFDVITGATPTTISPWGARHGPLLFPFDTNTTLQSFGCGPTPVVPEAPFALLLPISAVAVLGGIGALAVTRRRRPRVPAA